MIIVNIKISYNYAQMNTCSYAICITNIRAKHLVYTHMLYITYS